MIREIVLHYSYLNDKHPLARHHEITAVLNDGTEHRVLVIVEDDTLNSIVFGYKKRGYIPEEMLLLIVDAFFKKTNRYRIRHLLNPFSVKVSYT